jgi:hypothetical protein
VKSGDLVEGKMWNFDERHSRPFVEGVEESGLDNPPCQRPVSSTHWWPTEVPTPLDGFA